MKGDKTFFDTNILVYCFDQKDPRKRGIAHDLVMKQGAVERGVISYQVQQEFMAVAIRLLKEAPKVRRMLSNLEQISFGLHMVGASERLFQDAFELWERHSLSWYDAIIVAAALEGDCGILYTEDMHHGLEIDGLRIVNPFR